MSFETFFATVETDVEDAVHVVEDKTETALLTVWNVAKPLFIQFEPTLMQDTIGAVQAFLAKVEATGDLGDLEQQFLEALEAEGSELFTQITALASSSGSTRLQVIIGLVKAVAKV